MASKTFTTDSEGVKTNFQDLKILTGNLRSDEVSWEESDLVIETSSRWLEVGVLVKLTEELFGRAAYVKGS